ncbi:PREDICTED: pentatricopeptide repeat-containing protein At3g15590, mitochondrial [Brassica oleracea var. oleracea]|uniref:pentatricopeptide repeat-containing protein At3g15590, mitochondrial n=1 Tax=Brassica oleracea var. oleracea TaxID=109376 RepID=UPI0006A712B7|nr:PREDICTED: pentatricopeptide repeat-containing protein At3g15590, mitochondrial [Brassica oleracea var. oleracea]
MYSISKILRRSSRFNLAPSSFGAVSKLEISIGTKESSFRASGLNFSNKSQGLVRRYSVRDVFSRFIGINKLSSVADGKGDEEEKEAFPVSGDAAEGVEDDSVFDSELGSDVEDACDDGLEVEVEHSKEGKAKKTRARCELYDSIVAYKSVKHVLEQWVKEGKDLSQAEVSLAVHNLRKRRSYAMCLQLWEWLRANTQFEFTEANYASQLDLVAKVHSLQKAEAFLNDIPESSRGEVVYRTLLANCVLKLHVKRAEDLFNKMRELKFPTSVFACNQLLLLYSKHDRKKIPDVLLLMEKENIKPTRGTYQFLINSKGLSGDIAGMDKLVETMKEEGIKLDPEIQAAVARYYMRAGRKERAEEVMKEIEGEGLEQAPWVCRSLLPLYAEIGDKENVRRLSRFVEQALRYDNSIAAIKAWGKLKEIEEAEAVFDKLVEKYKLVPMLPYFSLMEIYTENKMLTKGKNLVKRIARAGVKIGPSTWHALVKLYIKAGEVGKAEMILNKATKDNKMRPLFVSYMVILEEYAKRGDVHNAEKVFLRMKRAGYAAQLMQYETVLLAYVNAKTPAYGMSERMKVDNVFPNKSLAAKLAQVDPFRKSPVSVLLDE